MVTFSDKQNWNNLSVVNQIYWRHSKYITGRQKVIPCVCVCWSLSHAWLFATPQTVTYKAPLSMGFSRQEYWSGLPLPTPRDPPDPRTKPWSPAFQGDSLQSKLPRKPNEAKRMLNVTNDKLILRFKNTYFIWKAKIARVDNKNSIIYCLWASQMALVVKNLSANAGGVRDTVDST